MNTCVKFMTVPCRILLRMTNNSDKNCRQHQNSNFMFKIFVPKIVPFVVNMENWGIVGQAIDAI